MKIEPRPTLVYTSHTMGWVGLGLY